MRRLVFAMVLLTAISLLPARAESPPAQQQIGSWELDCASDGKPAACTMRQQSWIMPPGGGRPSAALEVQGRGELLVPVVALRGLSTQAALGGMLTMKAQVALRLDAGPRIDLPCALDGGAIICAPDGAAIAPTAAALPGAHSATVTIQISVPGMLALPPQDRSLDLQGTREALARFRAIGPLGEALPAEPGLDWVGFVDRVLRGLGFEHGATDLLPMQSGLAAGRRP